MRLATLIAILLAGRAALAHPAPQIATDDPIRWQSERALFEWSTCIVRARKLLGDRYVRFPGWPTFLRSAHVEAIGGREKLLAVVKPAVVHDVGDLLYVQLSASVDDALAPETEARRQAFTELLRRPGARAGLTQGWPAACK
ncbi:MAG: hypothetical protein JO257_23005 [Deltaproteobacteria bacterium]|nr:hypothetical protein [Deltaproteobacteria bacterium]